MKLAYFAIIAGIALSAPAISQAQVAGSTLLGVSYGELRDVTWVGAPRVRSSVIPSTTT
ncbi:hypothetical protein [Bradyrhizobium sp. AS23.2]|uniref:hypothetical protein n=1 Tax=Bradyrhizobium sp. AS23.2 TaxID=1680155 RepID=UPI001431AE62|nr:hypothetical protein [Bradyrhizobium sp. AS23.2]